MHNGFLSNRPALSATFAFLICTATLAMPVQAAQDFSFSFTNDGFDGGNVAGTVTGLVEGLPMNGTAAATDVVILSAPNGLVNDTGEPFPTPSQPLDLLADGWALNPTINSEFNTFTTVNGAITSANFQVEGGAVSNPPGLVAHFGLLQIISPGMHSLLTLDDENTIVSSAAPAQITAVPEPMTLSLLGAGSVLLLRRRR